MSSEPLSHSLERLATDPEVRTLNDLVLRTEGRGIFLVMIVLCLPFISPLPVPGLSNLVGLALIIVAVRLFRGLPSRLPRFVGSRPWPAARMRKVIHGSLRFVRWMERFVKPRHTEWMDRAWSMRMHAALLGVMAAFLALPIPPIIPFSNSVPAYAIILLSASMMERDGSMIWFAYAASAVTVGYFALFTGVIVRFLVLYEEKIVSFLRNLL